MTLKVSMGEARDRELFAEGAFEVGQVNLRRVERVRLDGGVADGLQVTVAKLCKRDFRRVVLGRGVGWFSVEAEKGCDVHPGRDSQQPLLEKT